MVLELLLSTLVVNTFFVGVEVVRRDRSRSASHQAMMQRLNITEDREQAIGLQFHDLQNNIGTIHHLSQENRYNIDMLRHKEEE